MKFDEAKKAGLVAGFFMTAEGYEMEVMEVMERGCSAVVGGGVTAAGGAMGAGRAAGGA